LQNHAHHAKATTRQQHDRSGVLDLVSGGPPRCERQTAWLVALLLIFPSLIWGWKDRHLWPWDQAWYGEVAADLAFRLEHHRSAWFAGMLDLMPAKPSLLPWIGQFFIPIGVVFGDLDFGLLLVSPLAQAATIAIIWRTAREACPDRPLIAVAAALFLAAGPLFVGMSHQFLTEPLQTLIVAGSFRLAWIAPRLNSNRLLSWLALAVVAGAAVKSTTPAYCGLAWAWVAWELARRLLRRERWPAPTLPDLLLAASALVLLVFTAIWYAKNLPSAWAHAADSTTGEIAEAYGRRGSLPEKMRFWFEAQASALSLEPMLFALGAVFATLTILVRSLREPFAGSPAPEEQKRFAMLAVIAVLHIVLLTGLLALQINEDTRFLASLAPCWSILLIGALNQIQPAALSTTVAGGTAILALLQFTFVHLVAHGLTARRAQEAWLQPYRVGNERDVAEALTEGSCPPEYAWHYVVVGTERPTMNANSLSYLAAKHSLSAGYRCYYTSLGYGEKGVERALHRIDDVGANYVILPEPKNIESNPDVFNQALKGVEERIRLGNRFAATPGEYSGYKIYRRAD
jgi:4-amino-4-deoxy-L-arabinose transferase-like glycosyltransferase